jgi:hypothetical protein
MTNYGDGNYGDGVFGGDVGVTQVQVFWAQFGLEAPTTQVRVYWAQFGLEAVGPQVYVDSATALLDLSVTSTDSFSGTAFDSATVLLDLSVASTDTFSGATFDSATALLDLQPSFTTPTIGVDVGTLVFLLTADGFDSHEKATYAPRIPRRKIGKGLLAQVELITIFPRRNVMPRANIPHEKVSAHFATTRRVR